MKLIKTTDAVGHVLCHDLTRIVKGVIKDAVFRKGHIITEEDIPVLLSMGKDHLYIWEKKEGMLHENEAAEILYNICKNDHMTPTPVKEGKIELVAAEDGLLKIDVERLNAINALGDIMIATRHSNFPVKKGDKIAGTRVVPLIIEKEKLDKAVELAGDKPLMEILPFKHKKAGVVTTGNEVFHGRIKDTFGPVVFQKLREYDAEILGQTICDDNPERISKAINDFIEAGADIICCTGGMSVDPDDLTPSAIRQLGAEIVTHGVPSQPGNMTLVAYMGDVPILGVPGAAIKLPTTVFDVLLPQVFAGEKISKEELIALADGGLCQMCQTCHWPNCTFGRY